MDFAKRKKPDFRDVVLLSTTMCHTQRIVVQWNPDLVNLKIVNNPDLVNILATTIFLLSKFASK